MYDKDTGTYTTEETGWIRLFLTTDNLPDLDIVPVMPRILRYTVHNITRVIHGARYPSKGGGHIANTDVHIKCISARHCDVCMLRIKPIAGSERGACAQNCPRGAIEARKRERDAGTDQAWARRIAQRNAELPTTELDAASLSALDEITEVRPKRGERGIAQG